MKNKAKEMCEIIIKSLLRNGYSHQISEKDLEKAIMNHRGIDERTINRWKKALLTFEYIERSAPKVYTLNPFATPEILKTLKEKPQTKMY